MLLLLFRNVWRSWFLCQQPSDCSRSTWGWSRVLCGRLQPASASLHWWKFHLCDTFCHCLILTTKQLQVERSPHTLWTVNISSRLNLKCVFTWARTFVAGPGLVDMGAFRCVLVSRLGSVSTGCRTIAPWRPVNSIAACAWWTRYIFPYVYVYVYEAVSDKGPVWVRSEEYNRIWFVHFSNSLNTKPPKKYISQILLLFQSVLVQIESEFEKWTKKYWDAGKFYLADFFR